MQLMGGCISIYFHKLICDEKLLDDWADGGNAHAVLGNVKTGASTGGTFPYEPLVVRNIINLISAKPQ